MPPTAPVRVTDPVNLMTPGQICAERLTHRQLVQLTLTTEDTIIFCAKRRLLANSSTCPACHVPRLLIRDTSVKADGVRWRCPRCRSLKTIRDGSLFSNSCLELNQLLTFIYFWCEDLLQRDCARQSNMSERSAVEWAEFCRNVCQQHLVENPMLVGGPRVDPATGNFLEPHTVEIDESLLAK